VSFSDRAVARSTLAMTLLTAVSRVTGLVRLLVMAAVLGTTFLGNTYESANTMPNLMFELFAAGVLQAVLVPGLVELLDGGRLLDAERVAGSVLGLAAGGLAVLAVVGMVLAEPMMALLVAGVDDPETRAAQVRLGAFFLRFFLPQVVLYVAGLVGTAVLNAHGRFALPVVAPVVNNVVVTTTYAVFYLMRAGRAPSLDLSGAEQLVLAGGTTLGVMAFCAVPVVGALRLGFSLRPRFAYRDRRVRELGRRGAWAALYLAMTQVLLGTVLVLANGVEGGVVAYRIAFTFFLLPHALFAIPIFTALFPRMSREAQTAAWDAYSRSVTQGLRVIAMLVLPASAVFIAGAASVTELTLFGASGGSGTAQVARALVGFAPGLVGYGGFLLATRAFYAAGDTRTPAIVNAAIVAAGSGSMIVTATLVAPRHLVAALGLAHSAIYVVGTAALFVLLRQRTPFRPHAGLARSMATSLAGAVAVAGVVASVQGWSPAAGRAGGAAVLLVALAAGGPVYLGVQRLGGLRPATFVELVRSGPS
jgi:putative peptidoglycan lipid II flippase